MSSWPSINESPPELWAHFTRMRNVLRANTDRDGCQHDGIVLEPEHVHLDDHQDVARFSYPDVSYSFDREREVVTEHRPGMQAGYTSRGTIAYATCTTHGAEPLALLLAQPAPAGARWN